MASSSQLIGQRNSYQIYLISVSALASLQLDNYNKLFNAYLNIKNMYKVNDEFADDGKFSSCLKSVKDSYDNLNNNLIPTIKGKIDELSRDIDIALAREEEERRQREEEEEARRKEEEEKNNK